MPDRFPTRRHRYHQRGIMLTPLLAAALLLRSFIAPGFMLDVTAAGLPGIVFCNGPVSFQHDHSGHHPHRTGHGHDGSGSVTVSPGCSDWSVSGLGTPAPAVVTPPAVPVSAGVEAEFIPAMPARVVYSSTSIRAPPRFS